MAANTTPSDWERVEAEIAEIVEARATAFDTATRQNLADLIHELRASSRPAPGLSPGYWPTFRLTWAEAGVDNLEIEVFDDRYEVYRFFDGKTEIWYELHQAGEPFSAAFLSELPHPA